MTQEVLTRKLELLLANGAEENLELTDILKETNQTVEEYKNNNDLRQKLWKTIIKMRERDAKVNEWEKRLKLLQMKIKS